MWIYDQLGDLKYFVNSDHPLSDSESSIATGNEASNRIALSLPAQLMQKVLVEWELFIDQPSYSSVQVRKVEIGYNVPPKTNQLLFSRSSDPNLDLLTGT